MITEPKIERRKKQNYVAIRMAVPIPFGKYLQPAWDEVYEWMKSKDMKSSGPAIIRYLTTDMSKKLDIDVGFTVDKAVKGNDRLTADFLLPGRYLVVMPHFSTLDPTKAKVSSKRRLLYWIGQKKTKSNGIPPGKRVLSGGTGVPNFISLIPQPKKSQRSSRPNWRFWLSSTLDGLLAAEDGGWSVLYWRTTMNMKDHILAALREEFDSWEELLASLSEEQITAPHFDFDWSIKDVMAHLWAWQQISIARMEGGLRNREPEFPKWILSLDEDWEDNAD